VASYHEPSLLVADGHPYFAAAWLLRKYPEAREPVEFCVDQMQAYWTV
jgi:hypothetical protein